MEIVAVDIGGTHARFALATLRDGHVTLAPHIVLKTDDHAGLADAWRAFAAIAGRPLPDAAAIAVAAAIDGDEIVMTNNTWVIRPATLAAELGVARSSIVNDFAAVAHAVSACADSAFRYICGPDTALPGTGVVSVIGPGTGLGVALLHRSGTRDIVIGTEGGHIEFAPLDDVDRRVHAYLRDRFERVSVERVLSGSGLGAIHAALGGDETIETTALWQRALSGREPVSAVALARFCMILGAVAGDLALAHGAHAVVIAGGLGLRLAEHLPSSAFAERFVEKGRFRQRMAALTVKSITHPQPGLLGAVAAFAAAYGA